MSLKKILRDTYGKIISIKAIEKGGFQVESRNESGTNEWGCEYYGLITFESLQDLESRVLTLINATITDKEQRKATKDIFRRMFWFDWIEDNIYTGKK